MSWLPEAWARLGDCPLLGPYVKGSSPPELEPAQELFPDLVRSIIYQQLSGKAASAILAKFVALCGGEDRVIPQVLASLEVEPMRVAGLSRQKAAYVRDLAERVHDGRLPLDTLPSLSDDEARALLVQVKGIGIWTADMMLIFSLARPDVLPTLDLGIKKGFARVLGLEGHPTEAVMLQEAERWRPCRTAASLALWRVCDSPPPDALAAKISPS